ncbi:MAG TPA: hypothetical protein VLK34_01890 [Nocardioidaceae bacterium]|nr:hypothetical protein [Nocardioidaceae bacterium]
MVDPEARDRTRRSLHGLAELLLAGPQYAQSEDIRLRATAGGLGTVAAPDVRIDGVELVVGNARHRLDGTVGEIAERVGLVPRELSDVYSDTAGVDVDDVVSLDADAVAEIAGAFASGDAALRAFAPTEEPVLWPEHFDIGISVDEVNYGVSPGDAHVAEPYAYVGPWSPRSGSFWNMSFGAVRPMSELADAAAVEAFFRDGAHHDSADPPAS